MINSVEEAHARIQPIIRKTECIYSESLSGASGAEVWLKLENRQNSGSFKLRGVANKLLSLSQEDRQRRLVAASTGNHGAAFAHVVKTLGLDGLLFLPQNASEKKLAAIRSSGVPFELVGADCVETEAHASRFAAENRCVWVSPYNDPLIVAGQGSIAIELLDQVPDLHCVLAPVGGGGLISGIASYLKAVSPVVNVIGCQPAASAVMFESIKAGHIVTMESLPTLSDATAGGIEEGSITFDLCRRHVDDFVLLGEDEIAGAIRFVHENENMVIEGGAALAVAAVLGSSTALKGKKVALVVTGSKIDDDLLKEILS